MARTGPEHPPPWTIGQLAALVGVPVSTLRYYERSGLLPRPARSPSGYRLYDEDAHRRVAFIRAAQAVGFSLDDIRELLALDERDSCSRVQAILRRRLEQVEQRLHQMEQLRQTLRTALRRCRRARRGCPVLASLRPEARGRPGPRRP